MAISSELPLRVLVVDDSVVFRKVVSSVVAADPALQLVGTAPNGRICMQKVAQLNPDVITLDLEMPEIDGFGVLRAMKQTHPHVRIIVFSVHSEQGAKQTFDALQLGAADFLPKGVNLGSVEANIQNIRDQLLPRIKQFSARAIRSGAVPAITSVEKQITLNLPERDVPRSIVAIGASTGGPNALASILPLFPESFPVPIVIVQHMPPLFTRLLADRLSNSSKIKVKEAESGETLKAATAYIAPGNFHFTIKRNGSDIIAFLHQGPQVNSCRPAVDVLFQSVAEAFGANSVSVILTGMGKDGFAAIKHLKSLGSYIIAQDQATSVVWGMPGYVVDAGLANIVAPIQNIAYEVEKCLSLSPTRLA